MGVSSKAKMRDAVIRRLFCAPAFIASAVLVLRLAILYLTWRRATPAQMTEPFGYEAGCVAKSIVTGHGFSSPLPLVKTGPTAWFAPVYPCLLAGIFRIWGIYSLKSHIVAQALNCLFAALTVFPLYAVAKRSFGLGVAVLASWLWVVLPSAWHIPIAYVWDSALSALWFASTLSATLVLRERQGLAGWIGYGALWAIGAMINPSLLAAMPFLFGWLVREARKQSRGVFRVVTAALLVFAVGIAPWTIRNYRVFGRFVPIRSVLGIMLWLGNNSVPLPAGASPMSIAPIWNLDEARAYQQMGEINYAQAKGQEAILFARAHPAQTIHATIHRFADFWFEVSDRPDGMWSAEPLHVKALFVFNAAMILAGWFGIVAACRLRNFYVIPYVLVMLTYPLLLYVTLPLTRYRFPIDPLLAILAVYGATPILSWALQRQPLLASRLRWARVLSGGADR